MSVDWADFFQYDEVGSGLRWAVNTYCGNGRLQTQAGDAAGHVGPKGYYVVGLQRKRYYAHRLVWELHNGKIEVGAFIDHIDGNRANNHIENLRLVTGTLNQRNRKKSVNNTSGITGVTTMTTRGVKYWRALWTDENGKSRGKAFSVAKFGEKGALDAACAARAEAIESLGGYTDRHGQ